MVTREDAPGVEDFSPTSDKDSRCTERDERRTSTVGVLNNKDQTEGDLSRI